MGLLISKYVDEETSPVERRSVEAHFLDCPACRDFYRDLRQTDRVVHTALAGLFDEDQVWEGVAQRLREEPEDGPCLEIPVEPVSRFPWLRAAAAALLALALGAAAYLHHEQARLRERLASLEVQLDSERRLREERAYRQSSQWSALLAVIDDLNREDCRTALQTFAEHHPETSAAFVCDDIYVTSTFPDPEAFVGFDVYRREAGGADFHGPLNAVPLPRAEYLDASAEPGQRYEYRFVGRRADGRLEEGMPVAIDRPAPEESSLEVRVIELAEDLESGGFMVLSKDGEPWMDSFSVRIGGPVGETGFVLERIEEGDEVLTATFAWPKTDETGELVYDPRTGEVKVEYEQRVVSVRANRKAVLRRGDETLSIWRYGRAPVPPPE